ncbi:flavin-containing monooxygenase [Sphingoaurantiacus capsulatus]|uniref:Flavin-containing monooxygenase n=1 Tax=Sphingoaurantiacus capsulatus TaxID=1771310 RepID=A0ABV7XFC6_9SPHN
MAGDTGERLTAVIVGAGMSGLLAAIKLKERGIDDFVVLERSDSVGGTWYDNQYPGASCDVPSHLYSYSFAPNPNWTRAFARQPEILAYFRDVAERYGLNPHIRFGTEVEGASFDEAAGEWQVRGADGGRWTARILIVGAGQLNRPWSPDIEGKESFRGTQFHSARWNLDVDLTGQRVASIGNGASAVQYIPEIAPLAEKLTIFQRSSNWLIPRPDEEITPKQHALFKKLPILRQALRLLIYSINESRWGAFRKAGSWASRRLEKMARDHLTAQVHDPKLRELLTPDYPIGCKRILITDDYYPAVCRPNVEIVSEPIARIVPDGIETQSGKKVPLDVIIWGTGFATAGFLMPIDIVGRSGKRLHDVWANGAEAHRGVTVAGFPNMFVMYGPNTNLGHNSIIFMSERQMDYILPLIDTILARDLALLDVKPGPQAAYNRELQAKLATTVWSENCGSWYKHDGKITNNWSGSTIAFWRQMRKVDLDSYELVPRGKVKVAA